MMTPMGPIAAPFILVLLGSTSHHSEPNNKRRIDKIRFGDIHTADTI
jgi:hypothetical protein